MFIGAQPGMHLHRGDLYFRTATGANVRISGADVSAPGTSAGPAEDLLVGAASLLADIVRRVTGSPP